MTTDVITTLRIDKIYLDEQNPRLPKNLPRTQANMLLYLARNTSITELMTAIAKNGYFPGEPIVVVPRQPDKFTVIEGNRRLTALKLLLDPSLYPKNQRVRQIAETADHRPDAVPCVTFENRNDVMHYLGYRHISGVKQWEPLAKARYIAQYIETQTDADSPPGDRYREVARGIGSQAPYIKRQLDGFALFGHIEDADFYDIDNLNEETISFSLLSTAVGYDTILSFSSHTQHPFFNLNQLNSDNVKLLTRWMYEQNRRGETVLGDSRNIQRLAVIVSDKKGLSLLVDHGDLKRAFAITRGVAEEFNELLGEIEWRLAEAVSNVAIVSLDDGHRSKIFDIFKQARFLKQGSEDE